MPKPTAHKAKTCKPRKPIKIWASLDDLNRLGNATMGPSKWYPDDAPFILFDASKAAHEERVEQVAKALRKHPGQDINLSDPKWVEYWDNQARAALSALHPKMKEEIL